MAAEEGTGPLVPAPLQELSSTVHYPIREARRTQGEDRTISTIAAGGGGAGVGCVL